jgi:hypothetical protein
VCVAVPVVLVRGRRVEVRVAVGVAVDLVHCVPETVGFVVFAVRVVAGDPDAGGVRRQGGVVVGDEADHGLEGEEGGGGYVNDGVFIPET